MPHSTPRLRRGGTNSAQDWLHLFSGIAALWLIAGTPSSDSPPAPAPVLIVDPNTAPPEVLIALPRLGPALVGRIVAERREAPFASLEDLDVRVLGIGPSTLAALRPHLRIKGPESEAHWNLAAAVSASPPVRVVRSP